MRILELAGEGEARERFATRFWQKVEVGSKDECWPWKACRCAHGKAKLDYGRFGVGGGRTMTAHRVAYILAYGEIPDELFACHSCDYPPCCNPAHLFAGTGKENAADRDSKNRFVLGRRYGGSNSSRASFTLGQAVTALSLVLDEGYSTARVAQFYGVHQSTIQRLIAGKTYPDAWAMRKKVSA